MTNETIMWGCETLRLTTFHTQTIDTKNIASIEDVFGVTPDIVEYRPPQQQKLEVASLGPGIVQRQITGQRSDWVWTIRENGSGEPLTLGETNEVVAVFLPKIDNWLRAQVDINRLAMATNSASPPGTREQGYAVLASMLESVKVDGKKMAELIYQVNIPLEISVAGEAIKLNRLSRWACRKRNLHVLRPGMEAVFESVAGSSEISAVCEIEINSDEARRTPFSQAMVESIVKELIKNTSAILKEGDRV